MPGAQALVVYVVDDDASVREGLSLLMRSAGLEVCAYASPGELLAGVKAGTPGCILLDLGACKAGGAALRAGLRERGIDHPFIALSARDDEKAQRDARESGASFLMRKPADDRALLDSIAWVTGSPKQRGA